MKKSEKHLDTNRKFSKSFQNFVSTCLNKDPRKRPNASKLLEHKFLAKAAKKPAEYLKETLLKHLPPLAERSLLGKKKLAQHLKHHEQECEDVEDKTDIHWDFDTLEEGIVSKQPRRGSLKEKKEESTKPDLLKEKDSDKETRLERKKKTRLTDTSEHTGDKSDSPPIQKKKQRRQKRTNPGDKEKGFPKTLESDSLEKNLNSSTLDTNNSQEPSTEKTSVQE